ncbi:group III truncated hemoglobin [Pedobacter sp. GR22-6]|uniref:group III truncated hemoglobin n=1 Tax=Pedobacter sp. GR22-6 TaxID=3127957 RepID=UPI00307DDA14
MTDIKNTTDIRYLVETFYNKALNDELIAPLFHAAQFSLDQHIPIMIRFWETLLLDVVTYKGNPMLKHIEMNKTIPLKPEHFERWLRIWRETVKSKFAGFNAQQAINRAEGIARLMQYKMEQFNQPR